MKITAIAIDDEPNALEIIQIHAAKIPFLELKAVFRDAVKAIAWLQENTVDVLFLDINMPYLSGLQFRSIIGEQPIIVFTTAYSEFAVESYEQDALDYLLKPITFERFLKSVLKIQKHLNRGGEENKEEAFDKKEANNQLFVKSGTKLYSINADDIFYLEKDGNYITFFTKDKKILSRLSMQQVLELLPEKNFLKVHKSFIIHLKHIDFLESHQVVVKGVKIPVAKPYRKKLLEVVQ